MIGIMSSKALTVMSKSRKAFTKHQFTTVKIKHFLLKLVFFLYFCYYFCHSLCISIEHVYDVYVVAKRI